jgi:hypothetical protein
MAKASSPASVSQNDPQVPDPERSLGQISSLPLDLGSNSCNNYSVLPDESGGVSVWQK